HPPARKAGGSAGVHAKASEGTKLTRLTQKRMSTFLTNRVMMVRKSDNPRYFHKVVRERPYYKG
ncbi:MAG: hypothetical protein LUC93_02015, partial [Planctomycetaceae bacterium]|nr:hypothetical protein [Planctomycetaceae bacterium]